MKENLLRKEISDYKFILNQTHDLAIQKINDEKPESFGEIKKNNQDEEIDFNSIIENGFDNEDDIDFPPPTHEIETDENYFEEEKSHEGNIDFENEPPPLSKIGIELEFSSDRSYLYIFGPSTTGKTVLISSFLSYLQDNRSKEFGDTLRNLNDPNKKHEKEGSRLWNELNTTLFKNKFPKGIVKVQDENPIPGHINAHLLARNHKLSNFEFCFIDMSGEYLSKVNHDSNENLPEVIKTYIKELPKKNICFSYILNPQTDFLSKSEQINIFRGFKGLFKK
jgi:hypothetical protein